MYVRLAFSVAAHLETDILVADEVLAVGDIAFQAKSLGKMKEVSANQGRTILFVSHALGMVQALCPKCILLGGGRILAAGETGEVIAEYNRVLGILH
jgi:lipopolysaccharide transport system ATP-binding protein